MVRCRMLLLSHQQARLCAQTSKQSDGFGQAVWTCLAGVWPQFCPGEGARSGHGGVSEGGPVDAR